MQFNLAPSSRLWRAAVLGAALASFTPDGRAITGSWDAVSNIKDATDLRTDGTLFGAWTFRNSGTGAQGTGPNANFTLNGVTFTNITNAAGSGNVAVSILSAPVANFAKTELNGTQQTAANASGTAYNLLPNAYKGIVIGTFALLQQGVNRPLTITVSGLTQNKTYMVQFWCAWPANAGFHGGAKYVIKHPSDPLQDVASPLLDSNIANAPGGAGQYVTGTFTTGPGETSVTIAATTGNVSPSEGNAWVSFNAMQIREVDKYAWFKNTKYGIGINWNIPYPAGTTGSVAPGGTDGPVFSEFVRIKTELGDDRSEWAKKVDAFDVNHLANQAEQAGAGYVIFAVGGSNALYVAPNTLYEGYTRGTQGPFANGEFTAKRDLILDLANALNAKGIKLFVYFAAEGPRHTYYLKRTGGTEQYPCSTMNALQGVSAPGVTPSYFRMAYSNEFRTKFHNMLAEWSNKWKTKVAGWWVDGVFGDCGYRTVTGAENSDPVGNATALVNALKAGNPNALVALNPGADVVQTVSESQDYLAGETGMYYDGKGKFYDIPYAQFLTHGVNTKINTHYYSYLGSWWNKDNRKFVDEELIDYVSSVNGKGGVVSIAVSADATGTISDTQMAQLERLKAALKPTIIPISQPAQLAKFTNLALYKPAWLMRKDYNYGQPHLLPGVSYQKQPHAGVDGDAETFAQPTVHDGAGYTYGWSYIVDLGSSQEFDRVAVRFADKNYSTSYYIQYSTDGLTGWQYLNTTQTTYTNASAGLKVHDANGVKTGRFLRLSSALPSWPTSSPENYGMGVSELSVFNVNGTLPSTKNTVWVDEEFPAGATVTTAGAGLWETASALVSQDSHPSAPARWWSAFETSDDVPYPLDGVKIHWNKTASGHNEHGFSGASEPLRVSSGDTLYCDVYIDPANPTAEILLKWKASDGTEGRSRWGADSLPLGGYDAGALPATGAWVRLSVPATSVGLGGKTLTGMSFATHGGRTYFDRAGKIAP